MFANQDQVTHLTLCQLDFGLDYPDPDTHFFSDFQIWITSALRSP